MPWRCPACRTHIRQGAAGTPQPNTIYRCPVCRLELTFDVATETLTLAPFSDSDDRHARPITELLPERRRHPRLR